MIKTKLTLEKELRRLDVMARDSLALWDLPSGSEARLINVSENATYLIEDGDAPVAVLRVHRHAYNSAQAIQSELMWLNAIAAETSVRTPAVHLGRDGRAVQMGRVDGLADPRNMVLFQHLPGRQPDEHADLAPGFRRLGAIAASMHEHALEWRLPKGFERRTWDEETIFGAESHWGDWRQAPSINTAMRDVLERCETVVIRRLKAFGKPKERFGLIHADMRLANLLVDGDTTYVIDFDDCGFSWFLYDFAAAISFIETDPAIPDLKAAWLDGYRSIRALSADDEAEIDTFIMLRRMALLAWIGSHIEAPEPQALAPYFAEGTAALAEAYLTRFSGAGIR